MFEDRFEEINEKIAELFRDISHAVLMKRGWTFVGETSGVLLYKRDGIKLYIWPRTQEIEVVLLKSGVYFDKEEVDTLSAFRIYPEMRFMDYVIVEFPFDRDLEERILRFVQFVEKVVEGEENGV